jgi:hypothetical protein
MRSILSRPFDILLRLRYISMFFILAGSPVNQRDHVLNAIGNTPLVQLRTQGDFKGTLYQELC